MTLTMQTVRDATGTNGMNAISTFAGSGGSSTGHRLAGYRMLLANEFIPAAADTYAANAAPYTTVDRSDIRELTAENVLNTIGLDTGELHLMDGSPPCSAFSTAGKRDEGWGQAKSYSDGATQVVDDLFFEFARLVEGVQPKAFIAENVTGLVKGTARGYFKRIHAALENAGYQVSGFVGDGHRLGVPQERQRLFLIGARNDLGVKPTAPAPTQRISRIRDVAPYVLFAGNGSQGIEQNAKNSFQRGFRARDKPLGTLGAGPVFPVSNSPSGVLVTDPIRDPFRAMRDPETGKTLDIGTGKTAARMHDRARRAANGKRVLVRWATLQEVRAFAGFPTDFELTGNFNQRWERLGRAVPPIMMSHISAHVRDTILTEKAA